MRGINRVTRDIVPVTAMKTYAVAAPLATHWRAATCVEVDCPNHLHGWVTRVDERTELGVSQAIYVRSQAGRRYREERDEGGLTVFTFEAGQTCFGQHRTPIGRPELFIVRDGDHRGNPTGNRRVHQRPEDWVEDFALHQSRLADQA